MSPTYPQYANEIWIGFAGAMLVLLRSILDGTRRTWYALLVGCVLGGAGAAMAGHVFAESKWVYPICGVAAVMTENVMLGLFKASQEFSEKPIDVFSRVWRLVMPTFGKNTGSDDPQPVG
ncbi:hypothetical protein LAV_00119 [Sphingobium phage Lacusarx]|uniref:Holin n=1 Tax=Sphingobium phage Lacusarx TaxID=1980139 RepID=A0A1W6DX59_9CAUD|nr:hypothetical protein FDH44_gp184 [Sphingobium phage Lacusarx]ARK07494.1 hypothetical protein LAV_00119 [Sphingobium phage Lacusarx]